MRLAKAAPRSDSDLPQRGVLGEERTRYQHTAPVMWMRQERSQLHVSADRNRSYRSQTGDSAIESHNLRLKKFSFKSSLTFCFSWDAGKVVGINVFSDETLLCCHDAAVGTFTFGEKKTR